MRTFLILESPAPEAIRVLSEAGIVALEAKCGTCAEHGTVNRRRSKYGLTPVYDCGPLKIRTADSFVCNIYEPRASTPDETLERR